MEVIAIEVQFIRDLHHNYMVLPERKENHKDTYSVRMIQEANIEGILRLEQRSIDNQVCFYYDISGKQSLDQLYVKSEMSLDKIKRIFRSVIRIIERAYDHLLNENNFLLQAEYLYLNISEKELYLCYYPGYEVDIKEQMSRFIEYIMNKVDYNDKEAVLLVYNLYSASKENGFTFEQIKSMLEEPILLPQSKDIKKEQEADIYDGITKEEFYEESYMINRREFLQDKSKHREFGNNKKINIMEYIKNKANIERHMKKQEANPEVLYNRKNDRELTQRNASIPIMYEKVIGEKEIAYYPMKTYLYTVLLAIVTIFFLVLGFQTKIIYNRLGSHIDYSKLFALLLLLSSCFGYAMSKVWDKKNKLTRMVTKKDYIDPRKEYKENERIISQRESFQRVLNHSASDNFNKATQNKIKEDNQEYLPYEKRKETEKILEEEDNPTCLLNAAEEVNEGILLKPLDKEYEPIHLNDFPFFIGKLKKNVDYCLEKNVISRYHAKITKEEGGYYLYDLNSTNGTFLNGELLQTYQGKEIKHGDEIAFANIKYTFYNPLA